MQRAIIIITLILLSFGLKAQVYQAMPQAGYGPVKRMLFDSVLTIPLNINSLRNISGGRDAGQIRYNVTDSGLYVFSGFQWIKANLDSSNISNRINGKLNISDTAQMLSVYLRKLDTASLSRRIDLRVKYSDTAQMLSVYLRKLDTASLSDRINAKQNAITLTTNFKSGASTLIGSTLNIPKYSDTLQDNYVPYVGAIKDVDLGAYQLNANGIKADYLLQVKNTPFSITPTIDYTSITPDKTGFVFYSSWMSGQTTNTQSNRFNYANQSQQNNTREYNLPVRNGTLALVEDTVNLSNRINLKADKATTITINSQTFDLSANRTYTIPVVDTTSLSNRLNLKLNISDTAAMLSPYLKKADTSSLSNRIDLKLNISDTASMLSGYQTAINSKLNPSDTVSLSNRINTKQGLITLTTNGNSGPASFLSNVLNIPNYTIDVTGFVPYTGANQNVNLGIYDLTADVVNGSKGSFSSNGSGNTFDISHTSGSGIGLNITKGGSGEGLYINKTSGSGNAATIIGTLNATTIVKNGGTSSQFLKADGTVDTNSYISDTTSLSNRINLKLNSTDTASLSNRINAKADALSGTTNTVPKFTSATTIGNSNIKDNGSAVSVNTTAGSFGALQVGTYNGNILMNTTNTNGGLIFQNTSSSNKLWDFSSDNNDVVFNESNVAPVMKLKAGGNVQVYNLSGTGTRMVTADLNGVLSTQAISSDTTSLSNRINLKLNISDTASMLSGYQSAINSKQPQLNGTGFVKASGTSISYDNNTYYLASNPNGYTSNTGTVTSVATGLGLSGGTITTSGTLLVDTASASILSRQRAANTYATTSSLSGYLPLTGGTLTGAIQINTNTTGLILNRTAVTNYTGVSYLTGGVGQWFVGMRENLSSNNYVIYNENGTDALTISKSNSNVLIGTTTDAGYKLDVNGTGRFTGDLKISGALIGGDAGFNIGIDYNTGGTPQFAFYGGTTAEKFKVTSTGAATFSSSVTANSNSTINGGGVNTLLVNANSTTNTVKFTSTGGASSRMISELSKVEENSATIDFRTHGSTYGPETLFSSAAANTSMILGLPAAGAVFAIGNYNNGPMVLGTYNTERMRITSGGDVLVGTTTNTGVGKVQVRDAPFEVINSYYWLFNTGNSSRYGLLNNGSGSLVLNLFGTGNVGSFNMATGVYTPLSDVNKKKDFEASTIGLNEILQLKPTLYRMKDENNTNKHLGFIAQEIKNVIPQAYTESGEGKDKFIGLDYQAITSALVKSVQELSAQIKDLQIKIQTLENK
jgi:hypothetical protein